MFLRKMREMPERHLERERALLAKVRAALNFAPPGLRTLSLPFMLLSVMELERPGLHSLPCPGCRSGVPPIVYNSPWRGYPRRKSLGAQS